VNRLPEGFSGGVVKCSCGRRVKLAGSAQAPPAGVATTAGAVPESAADNALAFGEDEEMAYTSPHEAAAPTAEEGMWDVSGDFSPAPAKQQKKRPSRGTSGAGLPVGLAVIAGAFALVGLAVLGLGVVALVSGRAHLAGFIIGFGLIYALPGVFGILGKPWAVGFLRVMADLSLLGGVVGALGTLINMGELEGMELAIRLGVCIGVVVLAGVVHGYLVGPKVQGYVNR
jgi:hypothetical protein